MFRPVSADLEFVAIEEAELARWKANYVFERSIKLRQDAEPWIFYEGPPTANGLPGLHHVWARVYKDLFCRYHTMKGQFVPRKAGWDTHGLPVEVQVEKQLGISGKKEIEDKVGIAEFTRLCRESVLEHVDEFERLTERIGFWLDTEHAYFTYHPSYVESVWWNLKQLFERGLLYEDFKVIPYCPRCETGLSSHELGQPGRLLRRERRERLRATSSHGRRRSLRPRWGHAPGGVDDDSLDVDLQRRGRRQSRGDVRRRGRRGRGRGPRRECLWRRCACDRHVPRYVTAGPALSSDPLVTCRCPRGLTPTTSWAPTT